MIWFVYDVIEAIHKGDGVLNICKEMANTTPIKLTKTYDDCHPPLTQNAKGTAQATVVAIKAAVAVVMTVAQAAVVVLLFIACKELAAHVLSPSRE